LAKTTSGVASTSGKKCKSRRPTKGKWQKCSNYFNYWRQEMGWQTERKQPKKGGRG